MKKIGLISDTHSYFDSKIEKYFNNCDEIWHAGDVGNISVIEQLQKIAPVKGVYGNIDGLEIRSIFPKFNRFYCEKVDVLMTHIGGYPGRYQPGVLEIFRVKPPKLFICGHSHILKVQFDKRFNLLHINPGAAGKYGLHHVKTLVRFNIDGEKIEKLEIIELGKK